MSFPVETRYLAPVFDDLGFETNYSCRALAWPAATALSKSLFPELPDQFLASIPEEARDQASRLAASLDSIVASVVSDAKILREALAIEVASRGGTPWVREFTSVDSHFSTGLYGTPAADELLVATGDRGYLINVVQPDQLSELAVAPVLGVRRIPQRDILICWSFTDLAAYGPAGLLWHLEGLSIDDLRILEVGPDLIRGTSLEPASGPSPYIPDEHVTFTVDPRTGHVQGGSRSAVPVLRLPQGGVDH